MIVFYGPAGAGKSVQGQTIAEKFGWYWLSVGQALRDSASDHVNNLMSEGKLVPSSIVDKMMEKVIKDNQDTKIIIDGFPRELDQAKWLVDFSEKNNRPLKLVIVIDVPEEELLERLRLRGRSDDTIESIRERLAIYYRQMEPIVNYLKENGVIVSRVDGVGKIEDVSSRIEKAIMKECEL